MPGARVALISLCLTACAAATLAQPTPSPSPAADDTPAASRQTVAPGASTPAILPSPTPAAPPSPAPAPTTPACAPDEPCVKADRQGSEGGRHWFEGFVDIRAGDVRIQADKVTLESVAQPAGPATNVLTATGNVVFMRGAERLAGESLRLDLVSGQGSFEDAAGFIEPGVIIRGRSIERQGPNQYRIEGGRFTSCFQPNPRWAFSASSATIKRNDKITASNVLFKVKGVPAFYFPYLVYPIRNDQRSSGFLFPHFGYAGERGFNVGTGFFWAMGRSADQTFYADHYSRFGYGFGHELRYTLDSPSYGSFRSYAFRPKGGGDYEYDIEWGALQMLPGRTRASANVRQYSDIFFQTQFQDDFLRATSRTKTANVNVQRNFGSTTVRAYAEANDTFFGEHTQITKRHLPGLRLTRRPQRVGRSQLAISYEARAERLQNGDQTSLDTHTRLDVAPRASFAFGTTYLKVSPSLDLRYTRYSASYAQGGLVGPALERKFLETNVALRGPAFERVLNTPGNFYSEKYKHKIEPELVWRYRTRIEDLDRIPSFDGIDQFLGTNQLQYSLVNSLLAKRRDASGRLAPYEVLSWRLSQTYYANIAEGQNEFDPNYSTSIFGPGGKPSHYSPVHSRLTFKPTPRLRADFSVEYDVNFRQVRGLTLSTGLSGDSASLDARWSRQLRPEGGGDLLVTRSDNLSGNASVTLFGRRLTLAGAAYYDVLQKTLLQTTAQVRYNVQCCGFKVEMVRYDLNQRQENAFRFAIELANIGSIGNFLGAESRGQTIGGVR